MYCSYLRTSCIFIVYLFFHPPPALVWCWVRNSDELLWKITLFFPWSSHRVFLRGASAHPPSPRLYWGIISCTVVKPRAARPQRCLHYSRFTFPWWPFEPRPGVAVGRSPPRATRTDSVQLLWQEQSAVYRSAAEAWRPQCFTSCLGLNSNILFILHAASSSVSLARTVLASRGFSSEVTHSVFIWTLHTKQQLVKKVRWV